MSNVVHTTPIPLSSLIRDPFVRSAFERAERDLGCAPVAFTPRPSLFGGAAKVIRTAARRSIEIVGGRP